MINFNSTVKGSLLEIFIRKSGISRKLMSAAAISQKKYLNDRISGMRILNRYLAKMFQISI